MNIEKLDEMIEELVYLVEYHREHLEEKELQLKALQLMKEGEK